MTDDKILEIVPQNLKVAPDYIEVNEVYNRIIIVTGLPSLVNEAWLTNIFSQEGIFDASIHITPQTPDHTLNELNNQLQQMETDRYGMLSSGKIIPPSFEQQLEDLRETIFAVQSGKERVFELAIYINSRANSLRDLDDITQKIEATLDSVGIRHKRANFDQMHGLQSTAPLSKDELKATIGITTSALAAAMPFSTSNLATNPEGILFGVNEANGVPIIIDPFTASNPNCLVIGSSGSGKSFAVKTILTRLWCDGVFIGIVDPQGEYTRLAKSLGGQVIEFKESSKAVLNPFDVYEGMKLEEKIENLHALFRLMIEDLTQEEHDVLDEAFATLYSERKFSEASLNSGRTPPTFSDLLKYLEKRKRDKDLDVSKAARKLARRIQTYTSGSLKFFNKQTKVNLDGSLIVFDVKNLSKAIQPIAMFIVLDFLTYAMKRDVKRRKMIVVDEGWTSFKIADIAEYLQTIVKTSRKYNLGLYVITQELGDLANTDAGRSVLANTAIKVLFRQDASILENAAGAFYLNPYEKQHLLNAAPGSGLLQFERQSVLYRAIAGPKEYDLITTKPEEVQQ